MFKNLKGWKNLQNLLFPANWPIFVTARLSCWPLSTACSESSFKLW